MAPIHSHILPTFYVADRFSCSYEIFYSVSNDRLAKIVKTQGYNPVNTQEFRLGMGMESRFLYHQHRKSSKLNILRCIVNNDLFHFRSNELKLLIEKIKPEIIFIDIFTSTDVLVLYHICGNAKLAYINPMLSTNRIAGIPAVNDGTWQKQPEHSSKLHKIKNLVVKNILARPVDSLITLAQKRQFRILHQINQLNLKHPVARNWTLTPLFDNIPELILAPLELELSPRVKMKNQHYLGLCITKNRIQNKLNSTFEQLTQSIKSKKSSGSAIVYCAFGTFYQGPNNVILSFINRLIRAVENEKYIHLVCSVNQLVIKSTHHSRKLPPHIQLFHNLPQLRLLELSSLFITHGGLGSIKESIHCGVPMLVYPLDPNFDQFGNGLKIEHHSLGLRGNFLSESSERMQLKIKRILNDSTFYQNVIDFRNQLGNYDISSAGLSQIINNGESI